MNTQLSRASGRIRRSFRNRLRHFVVLAAGLMIVTLPSLAFAGDDDDPFDRSGPYIGVSGVYQHNVFEDRIGDLLQDAVQGDSPVPVSVGVSIEDSGGVNALVGYRLLSFFAAELQYEWVAQYSIEGSVKGALLPFGTDQTQVSGKLYSISGNTLTANGKFILPFWRIQPYLMVGVGVSIWNVDRGALADALELLNPPIDIENGRQTSFAGRAGLGLDLYLTPNIVLNAQGQVVLTTLEKPDLGDIDDLNYVGFSAGLQYRF
jgi:opacity protein-like surface antigen